MVLGQVLSFVVIKSASSVKRITIGPRSFIAIEVGSNAKCRYRVRLMYCVQAHGTSKNSQGSELRIEKEWGDVISI